MSNQFNTLIQSYSDNYVQYKLTGSQRYQDAYTSAQTGLDNIISQLSSEVDSQKAKITSFYNSNIANKLKQLGDESKQLQGQVLQEKNQALTAEKRYQDTQSGPVIPTQSYKGQYIAIGVLGGVMLLLALV